MIGPKLAVPLSIRLVVHAVVQFTGRFLIVVVDRRNVRRIRFQRFGIRTDKFMLYVCERFNELLSESFVSLIAWFYSVGGIVSVLFNTLCLSFIHRPKTIICHFHLAVYFRLVEYDEVSSQLLKQVYALLHRPFHQLVVNLFYLIHINCKTGIEKRFTRTVHVGCRRYRDGRIEQIVMRTAFVLRGLQRRFHPPVDNFFGQLPAEFTVRQILPADAVIEHEVIIFFHHLHRRIQFPVSDFAR